MSAKHVLGLSGNITRPSKTRTFVDHIATQLGDGLGVASDTFDIQHLGLSLAAARRLADLAPEARATVGHLAHAPVLVVGSPTFKGSYSGLFKPFSDLIDPAALRGKPVILAATGGG